MRIKSLVLSFFLGFSLFYASESVGQAGKAEATLVQDFLKFLASQNGPHNRIDKNIVPWKLPEVYVNDSLWAIVNVSDQGRLAARGGLHGAGPQLRMDYKLTNQEFEQIKAKIRQQSKTEWTQEDFPNSTLLQELNLVPASYYAYSSPIVLPAKKLILVKRYFRAEKMTSRWSSLEVYRIVKPGQYKLVNSYLRTP
ncbi:hypothetical protein [Rufibacter immobilis]|nr:hypothetical protein [Rufibacter immobilis]